jgi:hypothetical protein
MVDKPRRFKWDDFPQVLIHAQESSVKKHPSYIPAKSGDPDAAFQLVGDFISKEVIRRLKQLFHHLNPILASAHAIEGTGVNAIPEMLANMLSEYLGWRTDSGIVQTNIVGHTGADGFSRLARQALFDGNVIPNEHYVIADDFIGQGGTLANLRSHIIMGRGRVVGATVLTGKPYSASLALKTETLEALRLKHGEEIERWWRERFGFGFDCLTESEARYLFRTPNADRIRNKIVAASKG